MNNEKINLTTYKVTWKQTYPNWHEITDLVIENLLEECDMKEANEIINQIKGM